MNIAIVDDLKEERDRVSSLIREYSAINSLDISITTYNSGEELIEDYHPFAYTAIFMDIYMGGMTGIETAKMVLERDRHALIIFLTSSDDHMSSAFSMHVYDYIAKPAEKDRIFRVMDDLLLRVTEKLDEPSLTYPDGSEMIIIPCSQILSVATSKPNYLEITDIDGEKRYARLTFSEASETLLEQGSFLRVTRGTMVNMEFIDNISNSLCTMTDGSSFPVTIKSENELRNTWQNYMLNKFRNDRDTKRHKKNK